MLLREFKQHFLSGNLESAIAVISPNMVAKVYGKWLKESNKKESDRVWKELQKTQSK